MGKSITGTNNSGRFEGGVSCEKKTGWKPILHYAFDESSVVRESPSRCCRRSEKIELKAIEREKNVP